MMAFDTYGYPPYVSAAERRAQAARRAAKLRKQGRVVSPIVIEGRKIATTPWGEAWCAHMESLADYAYRLERGRTYVRNGSVFDLQIGAAQVRALVSGTEIYETAIDIEPLARPRWKKIVAACAGQIDSVVELLAARLDRGVMDRLCDRDAGLFPAACEIRFSCSCPDIASMCKHVAAVLYGVGARLDARPELLFTLRKVDEKELIAGAGAGLARRKPAATKARVLEGADLGAVFGIELATPAPPKKRRAPRPKKKR